MFETYFSDLALGIGISQAALLLAIVIWDLAWRCIGVWKSTKNNQPVWSVLFVLFQTIGILPILYIFVFSKMGRTRSSVKPIKMPKKKSTKKKK